MWRVFLLVFDLHHRDLQSVCYLSNEVLELLEVICMIASFSDDDEMAVSGVSSSYALASTPSYVSSVLGMVEGGCGTEL